MPDTRNRKASTGTKASPSKVDQTDAMMDMINNVNAKLDKMDVNFELLHTEVTTISAKMPAFTEIKKSLEFSQNLIDENMKRLADLKVQMTKYDRKQSDMEKQLLECQIQKEILISKLSKLDLYMLKVKILNFNAVIGLVGALILVKSEMLSSDS